MSRVTVALFDCLERFIRDDNAVNGLVDSRLMVLFLPPRHADTVKFAFHAPQLARDEWERRFFRPFLDPGSSVCESSSRSVFDELNDRLCEDLGQQIDDR